jgi:hypothetical protein
MTEPKVFIYEVGQVQSGQRTRDPCADIPPRRHPQIIRAQIAFRTLAGDSWGVPTELSFAK